MSSDDSPEGRCGFVLEPEDVYDNWVADKFEARSDDWYKWSNAVCCWRDVWNGGEGNRCIWHAETDDKPTDTLVDARADQPERLDGACVPTVELGDAIDFEKCGLWAATFDGTGLQGASFAEVDGRYVQFPGGDLGSAQFHDADLRHAQFREADLYRAQFHDANLYRAQFHDANLRVAQFHDADLYLAQFHDANLRVAQFHDADLRKTSFSGTYMSLPFDEQSPPVFDGSTKFGRSEAEPGYPGLSLLLKPLLMLFGEDWRLAARNYRSFQQTLREHALPEKVRKYRVLEMHARRKAAFPLHPIKWLKLTLARWTALYGESPHRVVYASLVVILGWTLLYPRAGGIQTTATSNGTVIGTQQTLVLPEAVATGLEPWLTSFYFSVVTFTTLGYGDLQPASPTAQLLATVESFLGALLMALLVYVLGRRATW